MRRGSFRFGVLIAYGFLIIVIRFAANALLAMSISGAHPDYDIADFYRQSMLMLTFFGTALVPLMTVRATSEILGHPRLAHIPASRKAQAHLRFSVSRAPFIGVATLLTLYFLLASSSAGFRADVATLYFFSMFVCIAGNYMVSWIFSALRLQTQTAESLLLALVVLRATMLAGVAIQRRLIRRAFAKMVLHKAPLTFLLGCSLVEAYILAVPLKPIAKVLLVLFLTSAASIRCGDAIFQTNAEAFALFRRKVPFLQYLEPVALYVLFLAVPLLLRI